MKRFHSFATVLIMVLVFAGCNTATDVINSTDVTEFDALSTQSVQSNSLEVLVPYYRDPVNDAELNLNFWPQIEASASVVPITAIINPSNNTGFTDPLCTYGNYNDTYTGTLPISQTVDMDTLEAAGVDTIGYISTAYTAVSLADAKQNIKRYMTCNHLDGIFFDEVQLTSKDDLKYYKKLCKFAKKKFGNKGTYVLNAGVILTLASEDFPDNNRNFCDTLIVFEDVAVNWAGNFDLMAYQNYQDNKPNYLDNSVLLHSDDTNTIESAIDSACERDIDYIYATDDTIFDAAGNPWANPWDTLGTTGYWDDLIEYINEKNSSSCDNQSHGSHGGDNNGHGSHNSHGSHSSNNSSNNSHGSHGGNNNRNHNKGRR